MGGDDRKRGCDDRKRGEAGRSGSARIKQSRAQRVGTNEAKPGAAGRHE